MEVRCNQLTSNTSKNVPFCSLFETQKCPRSLCTNDLLGAFIFIPRCFGDKFLKAK